MYKFFQTLADGVKSPLLEYFWGES